MIFDVDLSNLSNILWSWSNFLCKRITVHELLSLLLVPTYNDVLRLISIKGNFHLNTIILKSLVLVFVSICFPFCFVF